MLNPPDLSDEPLFFLIIEVVNKKQWTITIVVLIVIVHCGSVIVEPLA